MCTLQPLSLLWCCCGSAGPPVSADLCSHTQRPRVVMCEPQHRRVHGLRVQPQTLLAEHLPRIAAARLALVAVAGAPELLAAPDAAAGLAGLRCNCCRV
jgi:hypothetical protein